MFLTLYSNSKVLHGLLDEPGLGGWVGGVLIIRPLVAPTDPPKLSWWSVEIVSLGGPAVVIICLLNKIERFNSAIVSSTIALLKFCFHNHRPWINAQTFGAYKDRSWSPNLCRTFPAIHTISVHRYITASLKTHTKIQSHKYKPDCRCLA